jgi:hypothetical protein
MYAYELHQGLEYKSGWKKLSPLTHNWKSIFVLKLLKPLTKTFLFPQSYVYIRTLSTWGTTQEVIIFTRLTNSLMRLSGSD